MKSWVRRVLALGALLVALAGFPSALAIADTESPTPPASSVPATGPASPSASPSASDDEAEADLPDVPLDDTRTVLALTGAGVLALVAAGVVLLRR